MASFTYDSSVPAANHNPSVDQPVMQTNAASIASIWAQDHYSFGSSLNVDGQHLQVTFPVALAAPTPTGTIGIVETQTVNSKSELFYTNATANVQITNTSLSASNGSGYLPGGLQIRSGSGTSSAAGVVNTFNTAFPTTCLSVVVVEKNQTATPRSFSVNSTLNAANFTVYSNGSTNIYYIAIGY